MFTLLSVLSLSTSSSNQLLVISPPLSATQGVRIPSIQTILKNDYQFISLPQSLFYLSETQKKYELTAIKERIVLGLGLTMNNMNTTTASDDMSTTDEEGNAVVSTTMIDTSALDTDLGRDESKRRVTLMWRERDSYRQAIKLYPFVTNVVVPDMAFQLGPYDPIRTNHHDHDNEDMVDIILFLRNDRESIVESERNEESIRAILPRDDLTFKIVDWGDRLELFNTTEIFFTDTAIELLSLGKVVVCDRLHAAILSYLSGLPFVYIDQVSGKISKTLKTAFEHSSKCYDRRANRWDSANNLQEALVKATEMMMNL